jgi:DNA (cytosine-5)-methyltransferase 1
MKLVTNHIARQVGESVQARINALKIGQKMQDLPEELWHESFRFYVKEDPTRVGGPKPKKAVANNVRRKKHAKSLD